MTSAIFNGTKPLRKNMAPTGSSSCPRGCRHHSEEYIFRLLGGFAKKEYAPITFTTMNGHRADGFYYIGQK